MPRNMRKSLKTSTFTYLANELGIANTHFHLYKCLIAAQQGDCRMAFLQSWDFWNYTINAHIRAVLLGLCQLYDCNKDAVQLNRFVETLLKSSSVKLSSQEMKMCKADLNFLASDPAAIKLRKWRNKIIAHRDQNPVESRDVFVKQNNISIGEIEYLLATGFDIVERWAQHYSGRSPVQRISRDADDYRFVLDCLQNAITNTVR